MTAGIWLGNDDSSPMKRVMGGNLPAEIWHELMLSAHKDREPLPLPGTAAEPRVAGGNRNEVPLIARTDRPEVLPWLAPKETSTASPVMRAPVNDGRPSTAASAPSPQAARSRSLAAVRNRGPSIVRVAPNPPASAQVGQRLFVEPPVAARTGPAAASAVAATRAHPRERISEDFLAKVLAASPQQARPRAIASPRLPQQRRPGGFDPADIQRRIDGAGAETAATTVTPPRPAASSPRGMMSLGAGLGGASE